MAVLQACGQRCCRLPSVALVVTPSSPLLRQQSPALYPYCASITPSSTLLIHQPKYVKIKEYNTVQVCIFNTRSVFFKNTSKLKLRIQHSPGLFFKYQVCIFEEYVKIKTQSRSVFFKNTSKLVKIKTVQVCSFEEYFKIKTQSRPVFLKNTSKLKHSPGLYF